MTGVGASGGITLTSPVMADMYGKRNRGKSLAITSFLPYLGTALGPIVGGIISQLIAWQWIFWIMSIFNGIITTIGCLSIRETYTPVLLRRKARLENMAGRAARKMNLFEVAFWQEFLPRLSISLVRPFRILATRPVLQLASTIYGLSFGIYSILLSTFANLYIDRYGESQSSSSLHYIAIAIGGTIAAQVGGRILDLIYKRLSARNNNQGRPEFRVPHMVGGTIIAPIGLFWYGWSAEAKSPWAVVDIGAAVFVLGSFILAQGTLAYQLDEFGQYGASSTAGYRLVSSILAFVLPIFGPQLYTKLGVGWGNSLLAFVWIGAISPALVVLWFWGDKVRALGRDDRELGAASSKA